MNPEIEATRIMSTMRETTAIEVVLNEGKSAHLFIGSMSTRGKSHSMTTLCAEVGLVVRNRIERNNNLAIKQ